MINNLQAVCLYIRIRSFMKALTIHGFLPFLFIVSCVAVGLCQGQAGFGQASCRLASFMNSQRSFLGPLEWIDRP